MLSYLTLFLYKQAFDKSIWKRYMKYVLTNQASDQQVYILSDKVSKKNIKRVSLLKSNSLIKATKKIKY